MTLAPLSTNCSNNWMPCLGSVWSSSTVSL
jgi:hypothetical protein